MSTVIIGTNRITNCRSVLRIDNEVVLTVQVHPLRLTLQTPAHISRLHQVQVIENVVQRGPTHLRVVPDNRSVTIFYADFAIVSATQLDEETVHLRADLRPLGLSFYDDAEGLHVGPNVLKLNNFVDCDNAIGLDSGLAHARP